MPKLDWIGKDKVIMHHRDVPYRVLNTKYGYSAKDGLIAEGTKSKNMIIHGDNLVSLKALLPKYENGVDCIYIDPPYNTGNEKWVYNDNVNDPHIKKWINEVVGPEGEDLSRHDKWLCMMYPRLQLLRQLLKEENGVIFISIDENEIYNLKLICDEIFGAHNFIGQWCWFKSATPPNLSYKIKRNIEYILCYEKSKNAIKYKGVKKSSPSDDPMIKPQNSIKTLTFPAGVLNVKLPDGVIKAGTYGTARYPNILLNDLIVENGVNKNEVSFSNRFIWIQSTLDEAIRSHTILNCSKQLVLSYKRQEYDPEVPPNLIDISVGVNTTEEAGKELTRIFNGQKVFDFPKDVSLIEYLLNFSCPKDGVVLDSFAGTGTTAHAVLNLNKKDGGSRTFILTELMDYADSLTAERVKRVISGYGDKEGTGGDFNYYELGEPLFNDKETLNETIPVHDIMEYIFYSETRHSLPPYVASSPYFLGTFNNTGYYFYYEKVKQTTLDYNTLNIIREKADSYVVYADVCLLSEDYMLKNNIVFKKIPRDIKQL